LNDLHDFVVCISVFLYMLKIIEHRNRWIGCYVANSEKLDYFCSLSRNFSFFYLMTSSDELLLHHFTCSSMSSVAEALVYTRARL